MIEDRLRGPEYWDLDNASNTSETDEGGFSSAVKGDRKQTQIEKTQTKCVVSGQSDHCNNRLSVQQQTASNVSASHQGLKEIMKEQEMDKGLLHCGRRDLMGKFERNPPSITDGGLCRDESQTNINGNEKEKRARKKKGKGRLQHSWAS